MYTFCALVGAHAATLNQCIHGENVKLVTLRMKFEYLCLFSIYAYFVYSNTVYRCHNGRTRVNHSLHRYMFLKSLDMQSLYVFLFCDDEYAITLSLPFLKLVESPEYSMQE